ncbi:MAG TPA: intradiol ring-cleavage dioxygenase [Ramlibacter sp.]|nr:intradiol ring-cleavage dioxygenase [Ramlibacter sp.]
MHSHEHDEHRHGHGLAEDLPLLQAQLAGRRNALRWLGAGTLALAGCGGGGSGTESSTANSTTTSATTGTTTTTAATTSEASTTCATIPSETAGPYPGDGTNSGTNGGTANALTQTGVVRSSIASSFGTSSGTADGVPLTIRLRVVNAGASCSALSGYAVYLWHCDALGRYSMYTQAIAGENYLRGVQVTDSAGDVTFTSIFPGCYDSRWPHIHFEVFPSLAVATSGSNDIKTSQLALPASAAAAVYADSRYTGSSANLARVSLASDNVFGDGSTLQLATVTGSNSEGYLATLQVGVAG